MESTTHPKCSCRTPIQAYHCEEKCEVYMKSLNKENTPTTPTDYWEEAEREAIKYADECYNRKQNPTGWFSRYLFYLKQHYSLVKKSKDER